MTMRYSAEPSTAASLRYLMLASSSSSVGMQGGSGFFLIIATYPFRRPLALIASARARS
jgi:hypothetical protein